VGICGFSTKTRSRVHKVTNTYRRESLTNHKFKPKPNKARFKPKPNKSQTSYRMRGESFNTGLEASVGDLPTIPNLLVNLDLELHDVPIGPATKTTPFGRQKNEGNILGTASAHEVKEQEEEEEEERWRCGANKG
jgi:hypothetical protein